jgi:hypothetical protein
MGKVARWGLLANWQAGRQFESNTIMKSGCWFVVKGFCSCGNTMTIMDVMPAGLVFWFGLDSETTRRCTVEEEGLTRALDIGQYI